LLRKVSIDIPAVKAPDEGDIRLLTNQSNAIFSDTYPVIVSAAFELLDVANFP
jgi:hypothetical protein